MKFRWYVINISCCVCFIIAVKSYKLQGVDQIPAELIQSVSQYVSSSINLLLRMD